MCFPPRSENICLNAVFLPGSRKKLGIFLLIRQRECLGLAGILPHMLQHEKEFRSVWNEDSSGTKLNSLLLDQVLFHAHADYLTVHLFEESYNISHNVGDILPKALYRRYMYVHPSLPGSQLMAPKSHSRNALCQPCNTAKCLGN